MKKRIKNKIKNLLFQNENNVEEKPDLFHYLPKEINILFDVGAHKGSFTKEVYSKIKVNKTYIFEPIPVVFNEILADEFLNKFSCHNIALSSFVGNAEFYINENMQTSSLLNFDKSLLSTNNINKDLKSKIIVKTNTLNNFMKAEQIKEIDLLKIDVQGADLDVLKGLEDNIYNVKTIFTEVSFKKIYENSSTFFEVFDYLNNKGFILVDLYPVYRGVNSELLQSDALFLNSNSIV